MLVKKVPVPQGRFHHRHSIVQKSRRVVLVHQKNATTLTKPVMLVSNVQLTYLMGKDTVSAER